MQPKDVHSAIYCFPADRENRDAKQEENPSGSPWIGILLSPLENIPSFRFLWRRTCRFSPFAVDVWSNFPLDSLFSDTVNTDLKMHGNYHHLDEKPAHSPTRSESPGPEDNLLGRPARSRSAGRRTEEDLLKNQSRRTLLMHGIFLSLNMLTFTAYILVAFHRSTRLRACVLYSASQSH